MTDPTETPPPAPPSAATDLADLAYAVLADLREQIRKSAVASQVLGMEQAFARHTLRNPVSRASQIASFCRMLGAELAQQPPDQHMAFLSVYGGLIMEAADEVTSAAALTAASPAGEA